MAGTLARVVIINDSSLARGGATKLAIDLARDLRLRGVPVSFFAGDDGDNPELRALGVEIVALGEKRLLESKGRAFITGVHNAGAKSALERFIAERDGPAVVYHVHSWAQIFSPSIFEALREVAGRVAVTAHDFFLACPNGNYMVFPEDRACRVAPMSSACLTKNCDKRSYSHKLWRLARQSALRKAVQHPHFPFEIVAIQEGMIPLLVRGGLPGNRIRVIANPAARLCAERVVAEKNSTVLYLGRLEHEKGADLLAAACVKAGAPLRVIGDGEGAPAVRAANPHAVLEGWRNREELGALLAGARFLVMPSRCVEPFGLAAAEALAAGLPVMTSRLCLVGETIRRHGMGDIVDILDPDAFAAAIGAWMRDDARIAAMSAAAHEHATLVGQREDDWVEDHVALYRDLVGRDAARAKVSVPA